MPEEIYCKYRSNEEIENEAISFSIEYNRADTVPFPIEEIVEIELGIEVVPLGNLHSMYGSSAFFSADFRRITVDSGIEHSNRLNDYRFSLAHEIGHYVLHKDKFEEMSFSDPESWYNEQMNRINDEHNKYFEIQANKFASYLLMPTKAVIDCTYPLIIEAKNKGYNIRGDSNVKLSPFIAPNICRIFMVSENTANYRLQSCDQLWTYVDHNI